MVNLSCLLSLLKETPAYRKLAEQLAAASGEQRVMILDAAKPYLIATLYQELNLPVLVITAHPEDAKKLYEQLQAWCLPSANLLEFPELDFSPYEYFASYPSNTTMERLQVLATLAIYGPFIPPVIASEEKQSHYGQGRFVEESGDPMAGINSATTFGVTVKRPPLIVASTLAAVSKTVPGEDFARACHVLQQGMSADPVGLLRRWQSMGYEMEDVVEIPGAMS